VIGHAEKLSGCLRTRKPGVWARKSLSWLGQERRPVRRHSASASFIRKKLPSVGVVQDAKSPSGERLPLHFDRTKHLSLQARPIHTDAKLLVNRGGDEHPILFLRFARYALENCDKRLSSSSERTQISLSSIQTNTAKPCRASHTGG
jgi:hypothetical protein